MIQISFILPFYNGANTIFTALSSIFAMQMENDDFEVIVIDDCSPTPAKYILQDYSKSKQNVRIIRHKTNKRQGGAKNTGIREANGEYIAFIDQDDAINPDNMQKALVFAMQNDVDILACHYYEQHEDGKLQEYGITTGDRMLLSGKEFCEQYFQTHYNLAPWANLYNRNYLLSIAHPYEENVLMEDSDWIAWHWIHAKKIGIYNKPIYIWKMNPQSITHSLNHLNRADWIKYGYRKIHDAEIYANISPAFSEIMLTDGRYNIIGGMKKIWKVDNYYLFYHHIESILPALKKMEWPGIVNYLIHYQKLSLLVLSIIGPLLIKFNYFKQKHFK